MRLSRKRRLRGTLTGKYKDSEAKKFWALRKVDLEVRHGESLAVIGNNGAGKSTLLQTLAGIITPDEGEIEVRGRISTLLNLGAGFEDDLDAQENILLAGEYLGIPHNTIRRKLSEIINFADIGKFADMPARTYSSGMRARLGLAVATSVEPDVLLVDEVLSTGDASFRDKARSRILALMKKARAVVYVTHDLASAKELCTRAIQLEGGKIVADGPARKVINAYEKKMRARTSAPRPASRRVARKG
jgi:ABC-2 type transport system ATP-binding protein